MSKELTSYRFDEETIKLIDELRVSLDLPSATAVLEKSIDFLEEVSKNQRNGGCLSIVTSDNERRDVVFL